MINGGGDGLVGRRCHGANGYFQMLLVVMVEVCFGRCGRDGFKIFFVD